MIEIHILSRGNNIKKKAFTLLELIIVIIVIGVLAALALPNYLKTLNATALAEALAEISVLRKAVEGCYNNYGNYYQCKKITDLPVDDPRTNPAANFRYGIGIPNSNRNINQQQFWIVAARDEIVQGPQGCGMENVSGDYIAVMYFPDREPIKCGYGKFESFTSSSGLESWNGVGPTCTVFQYTFKTTVDEEYGF